MPIIEASPVELRQLFQNLIVNAIKFQFPDRAPVIDISCKATGKNWQFAIADNGIGIEEKNYGKIFDIFQRIHSAKK